MDLSTVLITSPNVPLFVSFRLHQLPTSFPTMASPSLIAETHPLAETADENENNNEVDQEDLASLSSDSDSETSSDAQTHASASAPRRLRRAEAILRHRTRRIVLVMELMVNDLNHQAVLRTAEALGIQYVYCIDDGIRKTYTKKGMQVTETVSRGSNQWLTIRSFPTTAECIEALKAEKRTIWATYLGPEAIPMTTQNFPRETLPDLMAIVIGREIDGISPEFVAAADKLVCIPQYGFMESLNVSVAAALVIQRLFDLYGDARGDLTEDEKTEIRAVWWSQLANKRIPDEFDGWKGRESEIQFDPLEDLRTADEGRIPRITPKLRKRMDASAQRSVVVKK